MGAILIRSIDEELKRRLRLRAAEHDRSMEEEVRVILRDALDPEPADRADFASEIRGLVDRYGAADDLLLPDDEVAMPMSFE